MEWLFWFSDFLFTFLFSLQSTESHFFYRRTLAGNDRIHTDRTGSGDNGHS